MSASGVLSISGVLDDMPEHPYVLSFLDQFLHALAISGVVVAIIAALESSPWRGIRRVILQASALALGVIAAAYTVSWIAQPHSLIAGMGFGTEGLMPAFLWFGFAGSVLFSWYYAVRERAARAVHALAEESVLRHTALRRADEARLSALRARVDPALLDVKLAGIHEAYRDGGDAGDGMLDDLIDYLSQALRDSRGAGGPGQQGGNHGGLQRHTS